MRNERSSRQHHQTANAEGRAGEGASDVIDEIREILYGDALHGYEDRLARAEELIEQLRRDLGSKFSDLKETPWEDLRAAIAALWYRVDVLDRRLGELDAEVRDKIVGVSSAPNTVGALDERLRAIEDKIWGNR